MNKSLQKLYVYIEEKLLALKGEAHQLEINDEVLTKLENLKVVYNIIRFYPQWTERNCTFIHFNILSQVIGSSSLSAKDKLESFFAIIETNLTNPNFAKGHIKLFNPLERENYFIKGVLSNANSKLTEPIDFPFITEIDATSIDFPSFIKAHYIIYKHYLIKPDNYTEDDVEIILAALTNLHVDEKFLNIARATLMKNITKRKKDSIPTKVTLPNTPTEETPKLSNRERKFITKELEDYYDLECSRGVKPLTPDEITYCTYLMLRLNLNTNTIKSFISTSISQLTTLNIPPQTLYTQIYTKIQAHLDDPAISKHAEQLAQIVGEMFITNNEDYSFWRETMQDELTNTINDLPNDGEFEITIAKLKLTNQKQD